MNMQTKSAGSGSFKKFLIVAVIVVLILAICGSVYAYLAQIGPFAHAPYHAESLATDIFAGARKINSAGYTVSFNMVSEPRASDAVPFELAVPQDQSKIQAYNRDQDKARTIQDQLSKLSTYYYTNKQYPSSIDQKPSYTYSATNLYKDFSLTATFETSEAVDAITKYSDAKTTIVLDKKITFTKGSSAYFSLPATMSQPGLSYLSGLQSYIGYIPLNFKLDTSLAGASVKTGATTADGMLHAIMNVDMSDTTIAADVEFRKIADNFYVIINKFPTFFYDISALKQKWIKITPDDIAAYGSNYFGSGSQKPGDEITALKQHVLDALTILLSVADKNHALISTSDPVKETVHGVTTYRYDLEFNKSTLPQFYTELTAELAKKFADKTPLKFNKSTLDYLSSAEFSQAFDYFRKNTTMTLWADREGVPIQFRYGVRMVPSADAKNSSKQIRATVTLLLDKINQTIAIDTPTGTMSVEDATIAMTGQSKEEYAYKKQMTTVSTLRSALSTYKSYGNVYPSTLADLSKSVNNHTVLQTVPIDTFTKQPFSYSSTGATYRLTYTQKWPPYIAGTNPTSIYSYDYSYPVSYTSGSSQKKFKVNSVDGSNTATALSSSEEADTLSKIDADKDGLPDVLEKYIGTNPNKKDTDGDGYSDADELYSGSNPLGPGQLKTTSGYSMH
jgi:hypothetical protein